MRTIGTLPSAADVEPVSLVLLGVGIQAHFTPSQDGKIAVWVLRDGDRDRARALLDRWHANPSALAPQVKAGLVVRELRERNQRARRSPEPTPQAPEPSAHPTVVYIILTLFVLVALLGGMGANYFTRPDAVAWLYYDTVVFRGDTIQWYPNQPFGAISRGQLWRLFTPSIMHAGYVHLFFNAWVWWEFGGVIERIKGSRFLLLLVLCLAVASNTGQYALGLSLVPPGIAPFQPNFLGFSGVNYGLFGYLWMKSRHDPHSGLYLSEANVVLFVGFFLLCWTGMLGSIANTAHTVGLLLGVVWGWLGSQRSSRRRR